MERPSRLRQALSMTRDARAQYVAVNLGVNLLFLLRSYVFMLVLGYRDLGLIALLQSVVLLLGMLQFGVLNGSYRLLLSAKEDERRAIVDFVYSFVGLLALLGILLAAGAWFYAARPEDAAMAVLGVIGGSATLVRNWQTNQMIAEGRLGFLNAANLGSALLSLAFFGLMPFSPLYACMMVIIAQPLLFSAAGWLSGVADFPRRLQWSISLLRRILAAGFVIFLAGMLLQLNIQLERWYVSAELGVAAVGHLFVAIMFVTLLQLVPNALDAVFLPAAVRAHSARDWSSLARSMRHYLWLLTGYALLAGAAVALLARPVLALLAPSYLPDLTYLYLIAPGALLLAVSSAFALTFSVLIRYRYLLLAYAAGSLALAAVLTAALFTGNVLSLKEVTIARSAALALTALLVVAGWWVQTRGLRGMRFRDERVLPD